MVQAYRIVSLSSFMKIGESIEVYVNWVWLKETRKTACHINFRSIASQYSYIRWLSSTISQYAHHALHVVSRHINIITTMYVVDGLGLYKLHFTLSSRNLLLL